MAVRSTTYSPGFEDASLTMVGLGATFSRAEKFSIRMLEVVEPAEGDDGSDRLTLFARATSPMITARVTEPPSCHAEIVSMTDEVRPGPVRLGCCIAVVIVLVERPERID